MDPPTLYRVKFKHSLKANRLSIDDTQAASKMLGGERGL